MPQRPRQQKPRSHRAERIPGMFLAAAGLSLAHAALSAETLFSVYTGSSHTRDSDLRLVLPGSGTDLTARDVRWDARPFKAAPYYGLRAAHFFERYENWGAALDFVHYKMYAKVDRTVSVDGMWKGARVASLGPLNQYVQRFEISHGVNVLSLNGIYRWLDPRLAAGRLRPYAGAGLAYYRPHAEGVVGNVPFETGYEPSGFGYQLLAGAQYQLTERTGLFVETKFNSGTAKVDFAGGRAETPLRTFHLVGGISFAF